MLFAVLFLIGVVVSGGIAFLGNWVGRTVGRRKLTLFGMRPRHTSTIVTVATGVFIFLATALLLIAISAPVRDMLLHQQEIRNQLDSSQKQLADAIHDLAQLQSQRAQAQEAINKLGQERDRLKVATPIFQTDAVVYLRVVECDGDRGLIEEQIDALLSEGNRVVIEDKNAVNTQQHQPLIPEDTKVVGIAGGPDVKNQMLDRLASMRGNFVVLLRALFNEFEDDQVYPMNFEVRPLLLCFQRGVAIASTSFPGKQRRVDVVQHMEQFLRVDAKKEAKNHHGLIQEEPIFDISLSELVAAQDRIVAAKTPVKLSIVANRDIYNSNVGHLDVSLVVSH